jgi:hypothetical protein
MGLSSATVKLFLPAQAADLRGSASRPRQWTPVVDRSSEAYQLIQSVVNQEMLHLQLVANIANSYGYSPVFNPAKVPYRGTAISAP